MNLLVRAVILELHGSLSRIPLTVRSVISYSTPASKSKKSTVVLFFEKYFSLLFPNWSSRKNLYRSKEFLVSDKFKVIELFVKDTLFRVVIQVGTENKMKYIRKRQKICFSNFIINTYAFNGNLKTILIGKENYRKFLFCFSPLGIYSEIINSCLQPLI